jgi:hypothetical protein
MTAIITITTISNNITSLNLYSNVDGFVSAFETNVPRSSLISGYSTNLIPIGTTIVRASSAEGPCTNYIDIDLTICQFSGSIECVAPTTTTTTTAPTINCIQYQIGTSSSFGIIYSYIDCEGIEAVGILGGVGGFDSDTFCAQEGSVNSGGMTLVDQGPCETPITTTTTTTAYIPVTGLSWVTTVSNPCSSDPWTISDDNTIIRYDVEDSLNCGGTCDSVQAGTATATITVDNVDTYLYLDFEGVGELENPAFEKITFKLDGVQIAKANAAGGDLECQMGPVVKEYIVAPPYFLPANSTHTFEIDFTTNDNLFHVGSYYEVDLSFSNSGTTTTTTTAAPTTTTTTTIAPTTTTTTTTVAPIGVNTVYVKYEIIT